MKDGLEIDRQGNKYWYKNNAFHREDGPAIEYAGGTKSWLINGKYHRLDGPAVERPNGIKWWFINGERIHCETNEEFLRLVKLMSFL